MQARSMNCRSLQVRCMNYTAVRMWTKSRHACHLCQLGERSLHSLTAEVGVENCRHLHWSVRRGEGKELVHHTVMYVKRHCLGMTAGVAVGDIG